MFIAEHSRHPIQKGCEGTHSHRRQRNGFLGFGGAVPDLVFFFFFRGFAAKKEEEKRIFLGDCIPQPPALQSGKPLKLTHMGRIPLALPTG
jgi:hypothetical protein